MDTPIWLESSWLVLIAMCLIFSFTMNAPINSSVYNIYIRFIDLFKDCENPFRHPAQQSIQLETDLLIFGMGRIGTGMYDTACNSYNRKVIALCMPKHEANMIAVEQL